MSDSPASPTTPHADAQLAARASLGELLDLRGQVALVTGAGQGVGETTARYLAAQGAAVAVNDYPAERAEAVAGQVRDEGGTAIAVRADVTDFTAVGATVRGWPTNSVRSPFWSTTPATRAPIRQRAAPLRSGRPTRRRGSRSLR